MITDFLITALLAGFDSVLSVLPTITLPDPDGYVGIGRVIGSIDAVFPLATMLVLLGITIAVELGLRSVEFGIWLYHQFWGSGS